MIHFVRIDRVAQKVWWLPCIYMSPQHKRGFLNCSNHNALERKLVTYTFAMAALPCECPFTTEAMLLVCRHMKVCWPLYQTYTSGLRYRAIAANVGLTELENICGIMAN